MWASSPHGVEDCEQGINVVFKLSFHNFSESQILGGEGLKLSVFTVKKPFQCLQQKRFIGILINYLTDFITTFIFFS